MAHVDVVEIGKIVAVSGETNKGCALTGACRRSAEARRLETCIRDGGEVVAMEVEVDG